MNIPINTKKNEYEMKKDIKNFEIDDVRYATTYPSSERGKIWKGNVVNNIGKRAESEVMSLFRCSFNKIAEDPNNIQKRPDFYSLDGNCIIEIKTAFRKKRLMRNLQNNLAHQQTIHHLFL